MHFPADRLDRRHVQQREFGIQETDVERRVVDDEFGAAYEIEEFSCDVGKSRLVLQELKADSVNRQRAGIDVAFRLNYLVISACYALLLAGGSLIFRSLAWLHG